MAVVRTCSRCREELVNHARFCPRCGLHVAGGGAAGFVQHPSPLPAPAGFLPFARGADLHFTWQPAWGERRLIGTEPVVLVVFNGGYGLENVDLRVDALNPQQRSVGTLSASLPQLERGQTARVELSSYVLREPFSGLSVTVERAEFAEPEQD